MQPKVAILAGGGPLPRRIHETCAARGREVFVVAFRGHTDQATVAGLPHMWARLGAFGSVFDRLREEGVREVCLVGDIRRPSVRELMPDWRAAKFLMRTGASRLGDDGLLTALADEFKIEGFDLVGAHDLLDDLLAQPGLLTRLGPDEDAERDIARGFEIAHTLGSLDVGQAVVVQKGVILAVEAAEGTDALLARCIPLRRDGGGGVLVKAKKPQQDMRLDLPTIGTRTVEGVAAAGLAGIAVEAGGALIVDPAAAVEAADSLGLFVAAVARGP